MHAVHTALMFFACVALNANADGPSIQDFVEPESPYRVKISPNGDYLSLITSEEERDYLVVLARETMRPISKTNANTDSRIGDYYWVSDDRLVFEDVARRRKSPGWASSGELYAIDADGSNPMHLFGYSLQQKDVRPHPKRPPLMGSQLANRRPTRAWAEVLTPRLDDPRSVTIAAYPYGSDDSPPWIYDLDVRTGALTVRGQGPVADAQLISDDNGRIRCAYAVTDREQMKVYFRESAEAAWTLHDTWNLQSGGAYPAYCPSTGKVYAYDNGGQLPLGLVELDLDTGKSRLLYRDPDYNIAGWVTAPGEGRIVAVRYEFPEPRFVTIDSSSPKARALHGLQEAFTGQVVTIISETADGRQAVVYVYGLRNPGGYYLYDLDKNNAAYLFSRREKIDPNETADVSRVVVDSSDGTGIVGYLTEPPNAKNKRLPLIIVLQDGPRSTERPWAFDNEAHLFASRGYAALRLTYRDAANEVKYGQDDRLRDILADVLSTASWAVERGIADPDRIAVYGSGFGGLLAIMSTIVGDTPFACALTYSGVFDLEHMIEAGFLDQTDYSGQSTYGIREFYNGILDMDRESLRQNSPLRRTSDIHRPVFVAHGGQSSRPVDQARQFIKTLRKNQAAVETHISGDQPGRFIGTEEQVQLYRRVLEFLHGKCVTPDSQLPLDE